MSSGGLVEVVLLTTTTPTWDSQGIISVYRRKTNDDALAVVVV